MKLSSVGWNLAGLGVPLLAALASIPPLLATMGSEKFGLLSLAWALTAVSGLFDLGIGRAMTRLAAELQGAGRYGDLAPLMRRAARLAILTGSAGGAAFGLAVIAGLHQVLNFSPTLNSEVAQAGLLLACAVPLQTSTAVYRGMGEAMQRFRGINLIRMVVGAATFAVPLLVTHWTHHLGWLVAGLLASRLAAWWAYRLQAWRHLHTLPTGSSPTQQGSSISSGELLRSGGWFTVSSIISPILVQSDRFFIGALVSAAAIPVYTIPFELVTQLLVITTAISTVAFPALASLQQSAPSAVWPTFRRWMFRVMLLMGVVCIAAASLLPAVLPLWIGNKLPPDAIRVGQVLCLGVWINSLGVMSLSFLHARGRFKHTALLHVVELPLYLAALVVALQTFGIIGAALAWTARMLIDTGGLLWLCSSLRTESARDSRNLGAHA